jgi:hypothetical protein
MGAKVFNGTSHATRPALATAVQAVVADGKRTLNRWGETPQILLDTGADVDFISQRMFDVLKIDKDKLATPLIVKTLDGSKTIHYTCTIARLEVRYTQIVVNIIDCRFYIIQDLPFPYIMGIQTIRDYQITEKFRDYFIANNEREERSKLSLENYLDRQRTSGVKPISKFLGAPGILAFGERISYPLQPTPIAAQTGG